MDQPKVWKSRGDQIFSNLPFKYTPFEISNIHLGNLKLVGFEEVVERIVKRVLERELKPLVEQSIKKIETYPGVVCWTCKDQGHYSRYCNKHKSTKSKVLNHTIGSQPKCL